MNVMMSQYLTSRFGQCDCITESVANSEERQWFSCHIAIPLQREGNACRKAGCRGRRVQLLFTESRDEKWTAQFYVHGPGGESVIFSGTCFWVGILELHCQCIYGHCQNHKHHVRLYFFPICVSLKMLIYPPPPSQSDNLILCISLFDDAVALMWNLLHSTAEVLTSRGLRISPCQPVGSTWTCTNDNCWCHIVKMNQVWEGPLDSADTLLPSLPPFQFWSAVLSVPSPSFPPNPQSPSTP